MCDIIFQLDFLSICNKIFTCALSFHASLMNKFTGDSKKNRIRLKPVFRPNCFGKFPWLRWKDNFMWGEIQAMGGKIEHKKTWKNSENRNFSSSWMFGSIWGEKDHYCPKTKSRTRQHFYTCLSFCSGGVCFTTYITGHMTGGYVSWESAWGVCISGDLHKGGLHMERGVVQTPPPEIYGILRDMVNKQVVCILLECFLVLLQFSLHEVRFNPREKRCTGNLSDSSPLDVVSLVWQIHNISCRDATENKMAKYFKDSELTLWENV